MPGRDWIIWADTAAAAVAVARIPDLFRHPRTARSGGGQGRAANHGDVGTVAEKWNIPDIGVKIVTADEKGLPLRGHLLENLFVGGIGIEVSEVP